MLARAATNCLTGADITLLADVPEYFPTRNLPDNYHYIGPLTLKSNIAPPSWWPPQKAEKPLIYIMGTTGIGDFFHKVYELFKKSDMTAIITTDAQIPEMETVDRKFTLNLFLTGIW